MGYDNPGGIIAASVVMEVVAALCVGLRFYTRIWKKVPILVTDWLILAGFICGTGLTVIEIYGVAIKALAYPLNGTIEDPRAVTGRLNKTKHLELSFLLLGILALGLIKTSVSLLYWHLFAKVKFRRFLIVWIIILIVWTTSFVLAGLLECGSHLKALFSTPQEYLHRCGSAIPSGYAYVGSDIATDFITLVIPLPVVFSLQLPRGRRHLVAAIFMIGALSVGASIAKAYIYIKATLGLYIEDAILILTGISIWNLVEVQVGIIAACGPTLRPILTHLVPTQSFMSLLSPMRGSKSAKTKSQELPTFVKSESTVDLKPKPQVPSGEQSTMDSYELEFRTDEDKNVMGH